MITFSTRRLAVASAALFVFAQAPAQVLWNEAVHGDLSGDRFNPTSLNLNFGSNLVIGAMGDEDKEYVHFHLAPGASLSQVIVVQYVSVDQAAFIGVQEGTWFTEPPVGTNTANLLGWALWGPNEIGTDMLPSIGQGPGAIGFTPPLTGSDYTFWIQQTGDPTEYTLDFVVVPEPGTLAALAGAACWTGLRRRQRRSRSS